MSAQYLSSIFSLEGQTAIVTGGTGGLGSALVTALVKGGCSHIASIEVPNDPLSSALRAKVEAAGAQLTKFECDLRDTKSLRACYAQVWSAGIEPNILLNCAGVLHENPCENATDEELDIVLDINVKSYYVSMQEFGRQLLASSRPGKIINIASVTCFNPGVNASVYSTSKGGVLQMTKAFSNEWAARGIQVNCIAPGFMRTNMTARYHGDQKLTDDLMVRVPMARWGEPEDLVPAILYLAAPGNVFTSGVCLIVDGGFVGK